jgi:hypothetical protein
MAESEATAHSHSLKRRLDGLLSILSIRGISEDHLGDVLAEHEFLSTCVGNIKKPENVFTEYLLANHNITERKLIEIVQEHDFFVENGVGPEELKALIDERSKMNSKIQDLENLLKAAKVDTFKAKSDQPKQSQSFKDSSLRLQAVAGDTTICGQVKEEMPLHAAKEELPLPAEPKPCPVCTQRTLQDAEKENEDQKKQIEDQKEKEAQKEEKDQKEKDDEANSHFKSQFEIKKIGEAWESAWAKQQRLHQAQKRQLQDVALSCETEMTRLKETMEMQQEDIHHQYLLKSEKKNEEWEEKLAKRQRDNDAMQLDAEASQGSKEKEIQNLRSAKSELELDVQKAGEELELKDRELELLGADLLNNQQSLEDMNQNMELLGEKCRSAQESLVGKDRDIELLGMDLRASQESLADKDRSITLLSAEVEKLKTAFEEAQENASASSQQVDQATEKITALEEIHAKLVLGYDVSTKRIAECESDILRLTDTVEVMLKDKMALEGEGNILKLEISQQKILELEGQGKKLGLDLDKANASTKLLVEKMKSLESTLSMKKCTLESISANFQCAVFENIIQQKLLQSVHGQLVDLRGLLVEGRSVAATDTTDVQRIIASVENNFVRRRGHGAANKLPRNINSLEVFSRNDMSLQGDDARSGSDSGKATTEPSASISKVDFFHPVCDKSTADKNSEIMLKLESIVAKTNQITFERASCTSFLSEDNIDSSAQAPPPDLEQATLAITNLEKSIDSIVESMMEHSADELRACRTLVLFNMKDRDMQVERECLLASTESVQASSTEMLQMLGIEQRECSLKYAVLNNVLTRLGWTFTDAIFKTNGELDYDANLQTFSIPEQVSILTLMRERLILALESQRGDAMTARSDFEAVNGKLNQARKDAEVAKQQFAQVKQTADNLESQLVSMSLKVDSAQNDNVRLQTQWKQMENDLSEMSKLQESSPAVPEPSNSTIALKPSVHFAQDESSHQTRTSNVAVEALDVAALHYDLINFEHEIIGRSTIQNIPLSSFPPPLILYLVAS